MRELHGQLVAGVHAEMAGEVVGDEHAVLVEVAAPPLTKPRSTTSLEDRRVDAAHGLDVAADRAVGEAHRTPPS